LTGFFTVAPDPVVAGIQDTSHGSGGACIVADLAKHGAPALSCTTNAQCSQAWVDYNQANLDNPNYDAAAFGVVPNGHCVANRCWYRPADAACQRRPFPNVWSFGQHEVGPIDFAHVARMYGQDAKIDWQVITCANRAQSDGTDAPSCAQSSGIYDPPIVASAKAKSTDWESQTRLPPNQ
jgi:hypothetical protein